ncbi:hypothetical protein CN918_26500 [Priestia megaterium]|nr:hypothetical protein CN918_26500 [Priestia megaterium]
MDEFDLGIEDEFELKYFYDEDNTYDICVGRYTVGQVVMRIETDMVTIDFFDIHPMHQRYGFGRRVIEVVQDAYPHACISGKAVGRSVPFWEKMNATFHHKAYMDYLFAPDKENYEKLIPFVIQEKGNIPAIP